MKQKKIATRILSGNIVLTLVFSLILVIVFGLLVNIYVDYREESEQQMRLSRVSKSLDIQVSTAQEVANALYWDAEIREMATVGAGNIDTEAVRQAVRMRTDSVRAKNMEMHVSLLEHSLDSVIGAERVSSVLSFLKSEGFGETSAMNIANYFVSNSTDLAYYLMEGSSSGALNSRLAIVERKFYNSVPIYFFTFVDLNDFVYTESTTDTMMIMSEELLLASSNYSQGASRKGLYALLERMGGFQSILDKSYIESGYRYVVSQSEVMRWYYVIAAPYNYFSVLRMNLYLLCLAGLLLVLALGLGLAHLLRRYAYAPLAKTVDTLSAYTQAHCDAEDVYICETTKILADQRQSLAEENVRYRKRENIETLRYMLRGIKPDEDTQRELEQSFCIDTDGPYRVCVLEFAKYTHLQETFSEEMICEIRRQIVEFIAQQLEENMIASPMIMDYKSFVVITAGVEMRTLRAKLMNVVATVSGSFEAELAGAIGELCERLSDVGHSYNSALKILDTHYSLGSRNAIVTGEDVGVNMGGGGLYYPIDTERELIAEVIRCHDTEVAEILTLLLDENFEKQALTKSRLDSFSFSIASTVNRIADTLGKSMAEIFGEGNIVFLDLKMCTDKMEVRSMVYGIFNTLIEFVQKQTPDTERDISVLMVEYIHTHYNEDISLSTLSAAFSLSLSYTSTLFKEATGENFKDYLSRYRVKRACDILLAEPNIKNTELARRVGCNTVATLLRLFNKYEGVTPGQYGKKAETTE